MSVKAYLDISPSAGFTAGKAVYEARGVTQTRWSQIDVRPSLWPLEAEIVQHMTVSGDDEAAVEAVVADLATLPSEPEPHLHVLGLLAVAVAATRVCGPHPPQVKRLAGQWLEQDPTARDLIKPTDDDAATAMQIRGVFMKQGAPWAQIAARRDWVADYRHPLADGRWPSSDEELVSLTLVENVPRVLLPKECAQEESR